MSAGPYETEAAARAAALWTTHGREQRMSIESANLADLAAALSGVSLGAYDERIIGWLAGWPPSTVAVICGLLGRARQATAGPEGGKLAAIRGLLDAFDWEVGEARKLIERIEQIAGSSRTGSGIEPGGAGYLTPADLGTVRGALADAAVLLSQRALSPCDGCTASPGDLCEPHSGDLAQADAYRSLAAKLGGAS